MLSLKPDARVLGVMGRVKLLPPAHISRISESNKRGPLLADSNFAAKREQIRDRLAVQRALKSGLGRAAILWA